MTKIPEKQRDRAAAALPGIQPVHGVDWIIVDDDYADQLAQKKQSLSTRPGAVLAVLPQAVPATQELRDVVLDLLQQRADFTVNDHGIVRPDGETVAYHPDPLRHLGSLLQEDLCILEKQGDEHVLTAALLCFPAGWSLAEKIGRPLVRIHDPVPEYDPQVAKRVQRLFDGVQTGRPLWRANLLTYDDPTLFQPNKMTTSDGQGYERSERQTIFRLPDTKAVVFAIHTVTSPL